MWALLGWDGQEEHGPEIISWCVPLGSLEELRAFAHRLCGGRYAKVFILRYAVEVTHPDFPHLAVELPEDLSSAEYLEELGRHLGVF